MTKFGSILVYWIEQRFLLLLRRLGGEESWLSLSQRGVFQNKNL